MNLVCPQSKPELLILFRILLFRLSANDTLRTKGTCQPLMRYCVFLLLNLICNANTYMLFFCLSFDLFRIRVVKIFYKNVAFLTLFNLSLVSKKQFCSATIQPNFNGSWISSKHNSLINSADACTLCYLRPYCGKQKKNKNKNKNKKTKQNKTKSDLNEQLKVLASLLSKSMYL